MNNTAYWTGRIARYDAEIIRDTEKLIKAYREAYERILLDLAKLYAKIGSGRVTYTSLLQYQRYKLMLQKIKKLAVDIGEMEEAFLKDSLPEYYVKGYKDAGDKLKIGFTQINREAAEIAANYPWSGADYSDRIWDNKSKLIATLKDTLTKAIITGKSLTDTMLLLQSIMENGAYNCRRLVRTETMHILNQGALDRYKNAGIKKIKYLAAVDYYEDGTSRTCETCIGYNGRIFDIDNAPNVPVHPNCRCTYIPVIE